MRTFAASVLCILLAGCDPGPQELMSTDSLSLRTGGSPNDAQFTVEIAAKGLLRVHRFGPPHIKERTFELHLPAERVAALLSLASNSTDFSAGCGQVADGTAATMTVIYIGNRKSFSCTGAEKWPAGPSTLAFLSSLNQQLPKDLQVF